MAKKTKINIDEIDYFKVRDLVFNYSMPDDIVFPGDQADTIQFSTDIVKMLSLEEEIIKIVFTLRFSAETDDRKEVTCVSTTEHFFKIGNFSEVVDRENFTIDEELDLMLTGIAYSTVRGLLIPKFGATWFSGFILPIAKPVDLGKSAKTM